jgi:hypothetical protein
MFLFPFCPERFGLVFKIFLLETNAFIIIISGCFNYTGHWLGLTHTFAGATMNTTTGCDIYGGDEILDTPAQENMGPLYCTERPCCNLEQDTCPHIPGTDPVWNFMDYSDDCCMERFTPMQAEKMRFS